MADSTFGDRNTYNSQLNKGIRLSGESKDYFARNRISALKRNLPKGFTPQAVLDFGCGTGDSCRFLKEQFPSAHIYGYEIDLSELDSAKRYSSLSGVDYVGLDDFTKINTVDLCYVNGVFHHIPLEMRLKALDSIYSKLKPGGHFAFFENNPWNLGTLLVMRLIPFDKGAIPISPRQAKKLLFDAGFKFFSRPAFLFFFPRMLSQLRFMEQYLSHVPFGAQYFFHCYKGKSFDTTR